MPMRITVGQLRDLFKQGVSEAKVTAAPEYMKKEKVREELQTLIASKVASGELGDQAALDSFLKDVMLSMTALKMIPYEVWKKLATKK